MGWNTGVIVSDKNEIENVKIIGEAFGFLLKPAGKIDFETASSSFKEGYVDVFFSKKGSIFFLPIASIKNEPDLEAFSENKKLAFFIISDVSSVYLFEYHENGKTKRLFTEIEGEIILDAGKRMGCEDSNEFFDDKMSSLTFELIGKKFWDFDDSTDFMRYQISD